MFTDEIFWRAVIGASVLGGVAGPIGCFVLWRRMAYVGASIAEMALLGAALGLIAGISALAGVLATSLAAALLLARPWALARGRGGSGGYTLIPSDTLIGLIGHAGLAFGFVALSAMDTVRADLLGYLFGDVLALRTGDVALIAVLGAGALLVLAAIWKPLLADTVSPEILAAEEGPARGPTAEAIFLALVAGLIAFGLQVVGALLIVALLIIPPAAARHFARTPLAMAIVASVCGAAAAPLGLGAAFAADLPAGPAIVLAATAIFLASALTTRLIKR